MIYRRFGNTGLKVSACSFGSWITFDKMDEDQIKKLILYAFDQGVNLFDTAEVYAEGRAENKLGDALAALSLPREKFMICSKVFWGGSSPTEMGLTRKHIAEGCHRSLKRLKTDYLDFYLCHRPDINTPIEETIIAMNLLIQQGKILYWGTSEWPNELLSEAWYQSKMMGLIPPSTEQFEYNLLSYHTGDTAFPRIHAKTGMGALVTMPLACGILTGRYNQDIPHDSRANSPTHPCFKQMVEAARRDQKIATVIQLQTVARDINLSLPALALAWCLQNQAISSVILGASRLDHLQENIEVIKTTSVRLSDEVMSKINEITGRQITAAYEPSYAEVIAES